MPIEIRELVIKTTVEKRNNAPQGQSNINRAELKQEILDSCRKMIKKVMKETKDR